MLQKDRQAAFDFARYIDERRARLEVSLERFLPPAEPSKLYEAMRYSVLSGG